jgi:hypothetical protein
VGTGGKRGPSTGVRISAKRQRSPLVLSPEQVKLGLAELEFRDQLLVFLEGALGIDGLPPGCNNGDVCGHPYLLVPNGECDDECEANIATRQNKAAAASQIVSGGTPAIRATAAPSSVERLRTKIRRRLDMAGRSATPSD